MLFEVTPRGEFKNLPTPNHNLFRRPPIGFSGAGLFASQKGPDFDFAFLNFRAGWRTLSRHTEIPLRHASILRVLLDKNEVGIKAQLSRAVL